MENSGMHEQMPVGGEMPRNDGVNGGANADAVNAAANAEVQADANADAGTDMEAGTDAVNAENVCAEKEQKADSDAPKKVKAPRKPIRVSLGTLILAILLTGLLVFQATFIPMTMAHKRDVDLAYGFFNSFPKLSEVVELYRTRYLYDVDFKQLDAALARTYIAAAGDPYTFYYTAEEWAKAASTSAGNGVGIGVYVAAREDGYIEVTYVMKDSPASKAGIVAGDIITAIEGQQVKILGFDDAVALVRGEIGSVVKLDVLRGTKILTIPVTRGRYFAETVLEKRVQKDGKTYAVLHLMEFAVSTADSFKTAVNQALADGVQGLIFDLRDNPGGSLDAVCEILDFLLPEGPIVHLLDTEGNELQVVTSNAASVDAEMAILVNGHSASASELFTSAMMDYNKATVVGTKTFGKGCGQEGVLLSDGSVLYITSFFYTPPFSENYDGVGITPHIVTELPASEQGKSILLVKPEKDTQLNAAIAALETKNK